MIELNEGIKMKCFICQFNVYFSRNWRKCLPNGEKWLKIKIQKYKFMRQMI